MEDRPKRLVAAAAIGGALLLIAGAGAGLWFTLLAQAMDAAYPLEQASGWLSAIIGLGFLLTLQRVDLDPPTRRAVERVVRLLRIVGVTALGVTYLALSAVIVAVMVPRPLPASGLQVQLVGTTLVLLAMWVPLVLIATLSGRLPRHSPLIIGVISISLLSELAGQLTWQTGLAMATLIGIATALGAWTLDWLRRALSAPPELAPPP